MASGIKENFLCSLDNKIKGSYGGQYRDEDVFNMSEGMGKKDFLFSPATQMLLGSDSVNGCFLMQQNNWK